MGAFAFTARGLAEAITYIKSQSKWDFISAIVPKNSMDMVRYANQLQAGNPEAFFVAPDHKTFTTERASRYYLYYLGRLDDLKANERERSHIIGYANAVYAGRAEAYLANYLRPATKVAPEPAPPVEAKGMGFWAAMTAGFVKALTDPVAATVSKPDSQNREDIHHCKHCGKSFDITTSEGYKLSMETFTCNSCYRDGKRDWATDYHDENTF